VETSPVGSRIDRYEDRTVMRLSTIALYQPSQSDDAHWADFDPKAVECVTTDPAAIQHTISQLGEDDWRELERKLAHIPRPFRPGLYHTPDA
jgi:hypothetical protein